MASHPIDRLSPAQYLAMERASSEKSEFYRGRLYAMRQADGRWLLIETERPDDVLSSTSIGCRLELADLYERVAFDASPGSPRS